ncbi:MAG: ubiquinol-cytochrome c reductase iron-sulfur subunit [Limisphaerales bacterium]
MPDPTPDAERRQFLKSALALAAGGAATVPPILAGAAVVLDPLRRGAAVGAAPVKVTTLDALPADGVPRKFPIIAARRDAWTGQPAAPVGAVYLRRTGEREVTALNVVCPHAGCFVDWQSEPKRFFCPCHNSSFTVEGAISEASSPSPRAMDALEVEVRDGGEVWVKFQNFLRGVPGKVPV